MPTVYVPIRTPFVDKDGYITRTWVIFLEQAFAGSAGVPGGSGLATVLLVPLPDSAGTTNISSVANATEGAMLAVTVTQGPTTGGRQITWSSQFDVATPVDILMGATEATKFFFIGLSDLKWHIFSLLQ